MSRSLYVVSNRLPIVVKNQQDGSLKVAPASGGLVTALRPILRQYGGAWIGWPGTAQGAPLDKLLDELGSEIGSRFIPVELSEALVDGFYYGFSNETLWPLFHDLLGFARFERTKWEAYCESNRIFADVTAQTIESDGIVWVNDYQLMLMATELRSRGVTNPLTFFLHIPFPSPDILARLPWREQLVKSLLDFDLVGLQTQRDLRNFLACVRTIVPTAEIESGKTVALIRHDDRVTRAGHFPISIDTKEFEDRARSKEVEDAAWYLHGEYPDQQILLGVDRLDYTKGLLAKFRAFERALEKYQDLHRRVTMLQIVVPSRQDIPEYAAWKARMDQTVGEINGRFARRGWMPLHYVYQALSFTELLGHYRAAEVCLVTPLKDGMNLVSKEYCAACVDDNGVLVLSEFAGSAAQLQSAALMVNPHDCEAMADTIHRAVNMHHDERRDRMSRLRQSVRRHNVFKWVQSFLDVLQPGL
ncbi:trehalose-6-phosphate synthase [bacterium]|nr:trehalose-6-phosphate synthase [bacterium]